MVRGNQHYGRKSTSQWHVQFPPTKHQCIESRDPRSLLIVVTSGGARSRKHYIFEWCVCMYVCLLACIFALKIGGDVNRWSIFWVWIGRRPVYIKPWSVHVDYFYVHQVQNSTWKPYLSWLRLPESTWKLQQITLDLTPAPAIAVHFLLDRFHRIDKFVIVSIGHVAGFIIFYVVCFISHP